MSNSELILIVDDHVVNIRVLASVLKSMYRIRVATGGEDALRLVKSTPRPDLILLDIMMPGIDGYTVCERLKSDPATSDIPVIFLTARTQPDDEKRGFEVGAVDYVTKPIHPPLLVARVRAQLALAARLRETREALDASGERIVQVTRERDDTAAHAERLAREIAERERVEAELRASEARLRTLARAVEQAPASILVTEPDGSILYVNPFFCQITGYAREEVIGRNPRLLKSGEHDRAFYGAMWETLVQGRTWRGDLLNRKKDGRLFWESAAISPILDEQGRILNYVAVKEDIGDRKALERVKEDVDRIMRHDLKTPLNAIVGLPEVLLLGDGLTEDQRMMIGLIGDAGQKMLDMIELSLDLFKMETGSYEYLPQVVDLLPLLSQLVRIAETQVERKRLRILVEIDGRAPRPGECLDVRADHRLLFSLLSNLFVNAVEAAPEESVVRIELGAGQPIRLVIHNRGRVPPAIRAHFFEKYKTHGKRHGTGLGTYSAKLMAKAMECEIGMDTSDEDNATRVWLQFPAA